jgi:hypothetical protein
MGDMVNMTDPEVDEVAALLMDVWEHAEGKPVTASYVATFADMARAVVARQKVLDSHIH